MLPNSNQPLATSTVNLIIVILVWEQSGQLLGFMESWIYMHLGGKMLFQKAEAATEKTCFLEDGTWRASTLPKYTSRAETTGWGLSLRLLGPVPCRAL